MWRASRFCPKPDRKAPYIHKTGGGQRVSFQTWDWKGEIYHLKQYIIEDAETLGVSSFECDYRATRRDEITQLLRRCGFSEVSWHFPDETDYYQPVVTAVK